MTLLILQRLLLQFFLDIAYFPVWWYGAGVKITLAGLWHWFLSGNALLAPGLWLKNIFVPMFGQTDWQGRVTSFFVRSLNVLFRSVGLLLLAGILATLFLLWLIAPIIIIWMAILSVVNYV